jgi:hypothetical protein
MMSPATHVACPAANQYQIHGRSGWLSRTPTTMPTAAAAPITSYRTLAARPSGSRR